VSAPFFESSFLCESLSVELECPTDCDGARAMVCSVKQPLYVLGAYPFAPCVCAFCPDAGLLVVPLSGTGSVERDRKEINRFIKKVLFKAAFYLIALRVISFSFNVVPGSRRSLSFLMHSPMYLFCALAIHCIFD